MTTDEDREEVGDLDYRTQLGTALRSADPEALRAFLIEQARRYGDEEQIESISRQTAAEMTTLMHRMTLARQDLSELHAASSAALGTESAQPRPGNKPNRRRTRRP